MTDPAALTDAVTLPVLERAWAETFPELSRPVVPARAPSPQLLALNEPLAREFGFESDALRSAAGVRFLAGQRADGAPPATAQVYAGHQWGVFQPILGDGRAALLGEARDRDGRAHDIHLKGIGPTPMSRADGFAVVGPMLREFVMTEAMHALGVPTTRALAVIGTGASREQTGEPLPGAILVRTAASHVRFGSFEYARAQGNLALLRRLADHVIARIHPAAAGAQHPYRALFSEIVDAAASLTAHWMRIGFVHGVLSTDNVLVSGETIDYGPCALLDAYEPGAYFSSIDRYGRYAYDRQPAIMRWNLERLGLALAPLLDDDPETGKRIAFELSYAFDERYRERRTLAFRAKLGLGDDVARPLVAELTTTILALLAAHHVDFTGFWRDLAHAAEGDERPVRGRFLGPVPELDAWLERWSGLSPDAAQMRSVNPAYIPRNHIVEEALAAATAGDLGLVEQLVALLRDPYTERVEPEFRRFALPAPEGAARHVTYCGT